MADRVELQAREAVHRLIPEGARVLVAVSGGGDSVALLHLLRRATHGRGNELVVAHLDHALRRGSAADRRFVERLAGELELPFHGERIAVRERRRRGESPEEGARRVRRTFLREAARKHRATRIATGHTFDDQAETVLMRLVRGAGPAALAGMRQRGPGPFVRPLLGLTRDELRGYLRRKRLRFIEDPSNRDLAFDRNRVRLEIMPLIRERLNPHAERHLVAAAERLRDDAGFLDRLAEGHFRELRRRRAGKVTLPLAALAALDPVLRFRLWRLALRDAGADMRRIGARHLAAVDGLLRSEGGKQVALPGRLRAARARKNVIVGPASPRE